MTALPAIIITDTDGFSFDLHSRCRTKLSAPPSGFHAIHRSCRIRESTCCEECDENCEKSHSCADIRLKMNLGLERLTLGEINAYRGFQRSTCWTYLVLAYKHGINNDMHNLPQMVDCDDIDYLDSFIYGEANRLIQYVYYMPNQLEYRSAIQFIFDSDDHDFWPDEFEETIEFFDQEIALFYKTDVYTLDGVTIYSGDMKRPDGVPKSHWWWVDSK